MIVPFPPAIAASLVDEISALVPLQQQLWRFCAEYVLGTRLETLVYSRSNAVASSASLAVRAEIERLNQVLNHRRADSEISKLLRARSSVVSPDLFAVLQLSETWRQISRGAFDGRMGALLRLWSNDAEPNQHSIEQALTSVQDASITLDPHTRLVELAPSTELSLDAVAKGYIVDAALNAARLAAPSLEGIAVNVGGDIRCWGKSPSPRGWRVGISDPISAAENSRSVDAVELQNAAIATSGLGPRDRTRDGYRSTTISPFTGEPVRDVISASVIAGHTADADALATACLVLHPDESIALADKLDGVAARITQSDGTVRQSGRWPTFQLIADVQSPAGSAQVNKPQPPPIEQRWPSDWELRVAYTAYPQEHEPYVAVWITDADDRLITTLFMLGKDPKWARENFIWWNTIDDHVKQQIEARSQATTRSGQYEMSWVGVDDNINPVPVGKYIVHVETNQEHGKHTYRAVPIEIGRDRFRMSPRELNGMGEVEMTYGAYNDRFNPSVFQHAQQR